MYKLQVYIQGERLDLFKDETVNLNSSIQNIKDISKVFTDFSQSFSVPASDTNNKIFKHWYNADITGGFNSKVRVDATLELSNLPFKQGKIQLNKVLLKQGKAYSYDLTFFGNLVKLTDLFGEDELNVLDLSDYDHDYTSANVKAGIQTGIEDGNIIYPLISSQRNWQWDTQGTSLESDDIKYSVGVSSGIKYNELKPAIKVNRIIEAIENYYGITFSSDFFKDNFKHTNDLFLWLSREKGQLNSYSEWLDVFTDLYYSGGILNTIIVTVTPETGFEDALYKLRITGDTGGVLFEKQDIQGTYTIELYQYSTTIWADSDYLNLSVSSVVGFDFTMSYEFTGQRVDDTSTVQSITNGNTSISANMPKIKVIDFIGVLIKMFNLVVEPTSFTTFNLITLNDWYNKGTFFDLSDYIDISDFTVTRPNLYKNINFSYEETETILGEQFRETNGIGYGDLESTFDYDGGKLDINVPFENMLLENLSSNADGSVTNVHVGKAIDANLDTVETKPILFYNRGTVTLTDGFGFADESDTYEELTSYLNVGQENGIDINDIDQSLNFGEEIGSYTFVVPPINSISPSGGRVSLYTNYWEDYLSDLYSEKRREYSFKAIIPLQILIQLKLNDKIIIRDRAYIINSYDANLTNGEVRLELLNYIGEPFQQEFEGVYELGVYELETYD